MNAHLQTLIAYQAWRRGADTAMPRQAAIGEAIDYAIAVCTAAEVFVSDADRVMDEAGEALEAAVQDKPEVCKHGK